MENIITSWAHRQNVIHSDGRLSSIYVGIKAWIDTKTGDITHTPIYSVKLNSQTDFNPDTESDFMVTFGDLKTLIYAASPALAEVADSTVKTLMPIAEDKKKLVELKKMAHLYTRGGQN